MCASAFILSQCLPLLHFKLDHSFTVRCLVQSTTPHKFFIFPNLAHVCVVVPLLNRRIHLVLFSSFYFVFVRAFLVKSNFVQFFLLIKRAGIFACVPAFKLWSAGAFFLPPQGVYYPVLVFILI